MVQFFHQWGGGILASFAAIGLAVFITLALHTAYTDFMGECEQHHEHYECRVMYRSG